jgi:hypothetical protein
VSSWKRGDRFDMVSTVLAMTGKEIGADDGGGPDEYSTGLAASSGLLVGPERLGPADDCGRRKRAEITAVEGVLGVPIHQEDFASRDGAAAPLARSAHHAAAQCRFRGDFRERRSGLI